MSKPRVAIFDFACCEGCQLQIVNLEAEIVDLLSIIEPVQWREGMSDHSDDYDIAIIEGSITRPEDEERIRKIREKAKILVALGACATIGGVNKLKNHGPLEDMQKTVYSKDFSLPHLATMQTKSVADVVKVDVYIHGCPIDKKEFTYIIRCLGAGKTPNIPDYPVCVECKKAGNICRYEYNEICLGPVIRAGCGAKCPSNGFWCFGCRGFVDDPNVNAARDVMEKYGKTMKDLEEKLMLFNT
ncbi:MAG: hypothetical protein JW904_15555 [Spirochaetales bacterium]|nr:hypothetical protein [Spirochaetales bacterium]